VGGAHGWGVSAARQNSLFEQAPTDTKQSPNRLTQVQTAHPPTCSKYVANPSFSQSSFQSFRVTRSPNHMWATSWATMVEMANSWGSIFFIFSRGVGVCRGVRHERDGVRGGKRVHCKDQPLCLSFLIDPPGACLPPWGRPAAAIRGT
jgi:hypothetical protein